MLPHRLVPLLPVAAAMLLALLGVAAAPQGFWRVVPLVVLCVLYVLAGRRRA